MDEIKKIEGNNIQTITDTALSVSQVIAQVELIQNIMKSAMKEKEHFGTIPGCGDKKILFKAGAEKLNFTFRMAPEFKIEVIELERGHREYRILCKMSSILTGAFLGCGVGSCTTLEKKYRYTTGPSGSTGRPVPGSYWSKRSSDPTGAQNILGGKGFVVKKNTDTNQWEIYEQGEKVENENPADYYNTCLKMAKKRAMVDAVLTVTAASDIFTQDLEEDIEAEQPSAQKPKTAKPVVKAPVKKVNKTSAEPTEAEPTEAEPTEIEKVNQIKEILDEMGTPQTQRDEIKKIWQTQGIEKALNQTMDWYTLFLDKKGDGETDANNRNLL